jgi:hypothetical protein
MKSLERRIELLEQERGPRMLPGQIRLEELNFIIAMQTIWPDLKTAPKFLQAEYRSIEARCPGI